MISHREMSSCLRHSQYSQRFMTQWLCHLQGNKADLQRTLYKLNNSWFRKGNIGTKFETLVRRRLTVALKEW